MTIKEACIKVLTELGGRAPLKIICMNTESFHSMWEKGEKDNKRV